MKAVILAAGMSRRLRPICDNKPKCMLEINGRTIIENQIDILNKNQIDEIIIVVGYQKEKIYNLLEGKKIEFVENGDYSSTNSSYSLWLAKKHLVDSDFIYLNSDLYFEQEILETLISKSTDFSCIVDKSRRNKDNDSFKALVDDNQIIEMSKTTNSLIEVPGPFFISRNTSNNLFNLLESLIYTDKNMWVYTIFDKLKDKIPLIPISVKSSWFEIDTPEDYNRAKIFDNNEL